MISNRYIDWKAFTPSYVESEMPKLIAEASEALEKIENGEIVTAGGRVLAVTAVAEKGRSLNNPVRPVTVRARFAVLPSKPFKYLQGSMMAKPL